MKTYRNIIVLYYLAKIQGMKHTLLINPPQYTLRKTMVHDESFVLPSAAAFCSNSDSASSLADDADTISASRSSRPCLDDGWLDEDNCYQSVDEPADSHVANEWK